MLASTIRRCSLSTGQKLGIRAAESARSFPRSFSSKTASTFVTQTITENPVTVFSKSYCPFCTAIKKHFSGLEIDYKVVELDLVSEGDMYHDALKNATGQRTVPYVFIHGDLIGGYDDTSGIPNDVLLDMIKQK